MPEPSISNPFDLSPTPVPTDTLVAPITTETPTITPEESAFNAFGEALPTATPTPTPSPVSTPIATALPPIIPGEGAFYPPTEPPPAVPEPVPAAPVAPEPVIPSTPEPLPSVEEKIASLPDTIPLEDGSNPFAATLKLVENEAGRELTREEHQELLPIVYQLCFENQLAVPVWGLQGKIPSTGSSINYSNSVKEALLNLAAKIKQNPQLIGQ